MAYLAVNKDGKEVLLKRKEEPFRFGGRWIQIDKKPQSCEGRVFHFTYFGETLPFGSIIAMTGQKLTWDDEPIKI